MNGRLGVYGHLIRRNRSSTSAISPPI